jgi:hypothetical protein
VHACTGLTTDKGGYQTTLLRLQPDDVKRTGGAPLKNARFSYVTEQGVVEDTIAASCGKFFVTWNFRRCVGCVWIARGHQYSRQCSFMTRQAAAADATTLLTRVCITAAAAAAVAACCSAKLFAEAKNTKLDYRLLATANGQQLEAIQLSHTNNRATNADVVLGATHDALCATVL